jgi:heme A synthase
MAHQDQRDSTTTKILNRFAWLVFITAAFTYALIVFGGVVRITGSGMGCGNDWPLCNGQLIPPMDFETLIEYSHRLAAALVSIMVFLVAAYAIRHRKVSGFADRRVVGLAIASAVLLVIQVLVGAITVWLELPTSTVVLHLGLASILLATLLVAGLRARVEASPEAKERTGAGYERWALASAALGFIVLLFGALVANTGAAPLCQGFPLCNGRLFPQGGGLVHLHWTHRLLAYAEFFVIVTAVIATLRQKAPAAVSRWAIVALGLVIGQIWVAAQLVALHLPPNLRGLHLAVGIALWAALVVWATLAQLKAPDSLLGSAG